MKIKEQIENLNFHDSEFREKRIQLTGPDTTCIVDLDYYNWEGNEGNQAGDPWKWKRLLMKFNFMGHIEYSLPDLVNGAKFIYDIEIDYNLDRFIEARDKLKKDFPLAKYPLFKENEETISIKFNVCNWDDHDNGFIWIVGSGVELEWIDDDTSQGQTHIPIKSE